MVLGDRIIHNEKIETNGKGLLQILLADGTSFTVGPNSSMSIDSFVYDPDANTAKVVAVHDIDMLFGDSPCWPIAARSSVASSQNGYSIVLGPNHTFNVIKTPPGWNQSFQHDVTSHGGQHGAPHNTSGTIQTAFKDATQNQGGSTPPNAAVVSSLTQLRGGHAAASCDQRPHPSSDSTWTEISNSSLATAEATYLGDYQYAFTTNTGDLSVELPASTSGKFSLDYHFGEANGSGTMTFHDTGTYSDTDFTIPVTPLSPTSTGSAQFGYHQDEEVGGGFSETLNLAGAFADTAAGTANGVAGNFSEVVSGTTNEGDVTKSGTIGITGTFTGNLDHTTP